MYRARDIDAARVALGEFYDATQTAGIPECDRLARTIRRWEAAVLAYYTTDGLSNAKTEAINALMKSAWNGRPVPFGRLTRGSWKLRWGSSVWSGSCETLRQTAKSEGGPPWQDRTRPRLRATCRRTRAH